MAFTVQTDPPTVLANSYATVQEFKDYHSDRGNDISSFGSGDMQKALVRSTDYLDVRFNFIGDKQQDSQTTEWPRIDAFDKESIQVTGIPTEVKEATYEYAFLSLSTEINPNPTLDDTGRVVQSKTEKVGPIEEKVAYVTGGGFKLPGYPKADFKLIRRGLTVQGKELLRG